ncbi:receptor-like protein 33 [Ziziphus jujuba]|uniref:Receptor-like protein 33 n=1 Tax=Ziziphus jujuba TaxID=326968 RepID=A0ABM3ZUG4_ZIZJJ|nr:receptor-like protein 33 [Ziziphus jujuba]
MPLIYLTTISVANFLRVWATPGQVPRSLANCRELEYLNVGNNLIGDTFPFWLATLPELKVLMLSFNEFYGAIWNDETDHSFPKLRIIDLSHNHFSGGLPLKYFQYFNAMKVVYSSSKLKYMQLNQSFDLQAYKINRNFGYSVTLTNKGIKMTYTKIQELLTAIDFSSNEFEGEIPELLGNLKGLSLLNLSNNKLVGGIPASLGSIEELETLDLSRNKLSGEIPQQLTKAQLPQLLQCKHVNTEASSPPSRAVDNGESSENGVELDWKAVLMGYGSGVVFGGVIGYIVIQKKLDWFLDAFRIRRRVM